ncbi:DEAD/DEAH box helicase domain protein [Alteracholeplasma palmae J233]|uniref:DEAD/DEAH box helicase domain protein n=1 Tax=Alteracholeplasma palmae (strain ATCC 49389 / J233) TaxID=1318466 RepID=U4KQI0_ALTPJ|nr:DEAD/DEAH box helicase [Alteracholeplasma palmae]CCV64615.1 DEAD/DEAH box helicase domain protein [Alteracholeplasma palmae J233]
MRTFSQFEIRNEILESLDLLGYKTPTEVQEEAIPEILNDKNVVIKSKTGSGKTATFSIPLIQKIVWDKKNPQALILSPTRELAMQIKEEIFSIGRLARIKVEAIYGKSSFIKQEKLLKQRNHFIVATPGRLLDHMTRKTIDLSEVDYLVIDEADEMLKMGFIEQIEEIIQQINPKQIILLSATLEEKILNKIGTYITNPVYISVEDHNEESKSIQKYIKEDLNKMYAIKQYILENKIPSAIIFCNTQEKVDELHYYLYDEKMLVKKLHGGLEQKIRTKTIKEFKEGFVRYLVATDVASRGIDVKSVNYVINYEMPKDIKTFIHRVGRTGRMGEKGSCLTLLDYDDVSHFKSIMEENDYQTEEVFFTTNETLNEDDELQTPIYIEKKDVKLNESILKLHINAGKKTKMRAVDIVGTICAIDGIKASDIGVINILDISTFVDIMNNKGQYVFEQLQTKPIKGRIRTVSKVL